MKEKNKLMEDITGVKLDWQQVKKIIEFKNKDN